MHHIVKVRLSYDPATQAYRDAHLATGWSIAAVFRALKRAITRQIFQALTGHCTVPDYSDLRPARRAKDLTLTAAAKHLGVWPARIGELELGHRPNDDLAHRHHLRDVVHGPDDITDAIEEAVLAAGWSAGVLDDLHSLTPLTDPDLVAAARTHLQPDDLVARIEEAINFLSSARLPTGTGPAAPGSP